MSTAYVLVEYDGDQVLPITGELITAAKVFESVTAVVVGPAGAHEPLVPQLAALGADAIVAAVGADTAQRVVLPAADALSMLAASAPGPILVGAGVTGNEIAGRLAARLASGVLCDVVQVNSDLTALMSIFGDAIEVSTAVGGSSPIYTMRHGATEVPAEPTPGAGVVSTFELPAASEKDVTVTKFVPAVKGDRPDLTNAKVVVATEVEALADALGGAVGATRDVVDLGWYDPIYQIGQTGVTVSPDVYIGLGVSGAIQHTSGMQTAKKIIVINNDEDAPFFHIADLGVVGDLHEIVPLIVEELAKRK